MALDVVYYNHLIDPLRQMLSCFVKREVAFCDGSFKEVEEEGLCSSGKPARCSGLQLFIRILRRQEIKLVMLFIISRPRKCLMNSVILFSYYVVLGFVVVKN